MYHKNYLIKRLLIMHNKTVKLLLYLYLLVEIYLPQTMINLIEVDLNSSFKRSDICKRLVKLVVCLEPTSLHYQMVLDYVVGLLYKFNSTVINVYVGS